MAAVISTTLREEYGSKLVNHFDKVVSELEIQSTKLNQQFSQAEENALRFLITGMIAGTIVLMFSVFMLAPKLSKPISEFVNIFKEFSLGNFEFEIKSRSKDEFGKLMKLRISLKKLRLKINAAKKIAEGSLEKVNEASQKIV